MAVESSRPKADLGRVGRLAISAVNRFTDEPLTRWAWARSVLAADLCSDRLGQKSRTLPKPDAMQNYSATSRMKAKYSVL